MKKSLFALVILVVLTGILVSACDSPVADDVVVMVRIHNGTPASTINLDIRIATTVFPFETSNLAPGENSEYLSVTPGTYVAEIDWIGGWRYLLPEDSLNLTESGSYTVSLDDDENATLTKD